MLLKQFKLTYLITLTLTIFCGCAKEVLEKDIQQINSTQVTTKDALLDLGNAFDRIENLYYLNDSIKSWKGFTDIVLADPNLKEFITKRPQIANLKNQNVSEEEIFSSLVKKNYLIRSSKIEQINKHRLMLMNIRQILAKHYTENRGTDLNSLLKLYAQNTFGVKKLMSSETYQQVKSYEQPITNRIYNVKSIGLNSVIKNKLKAATSLGGITYKVTMYDTPGSYLGAFDCPGNVYILDGAENAGFDLPYSCRCGADAASAAKLIEGTVDQSDQSYLSDCQMEYGFILTDVGYATSNIRIRIGVEEEIIDCDLTGPDIHPPSNPTNPNNLPPWHPLFPELQDEFWEIVVGGATPSPTNQMLINCLNSATQHWIDDIDALNDRLDADELDCYAYNLALPLADLVDLLPSLTEAIKNARATQGGSLAEIDWEKVANAVTDIQEAKVNISDCLMDRHQDFSDRYYQRYALLQSQYNTCYTTHPN